jgi:hypothetical protein
MGKVVNMQGREMGVINGIPVLQPQCREEYLSIVKMFLPEADYVAVLCGILDKEYYKELERPHEVIVNRYFQFSS